MPTKVLVPSGVLGLGFSRDALARGVAMQPDVMAVDGGSTDSGPFYLGAGESKYAQAICRAQWCDLMKARAAARVPLIIGSSGTCGTDNQVDAMFAMTCDLARELGQRVRVARLYSGQSPDTMATAWQNGQIHPLNPAPKLDAQALRECSNIVALAGVEQMQWALDSGADVILAGRATDTAGIAALPIRQGDNVAAAWHGAKIAECGAFCTDNPKSGVVMLDVDADSFTIRPCGVDAYVTARSVSAHMLYENVNPHVLYEPGGRLEVDGARYYETGDNAVRVEGSRWVPNPQYCVKLEGARLGGYQTTLMAIIRDAHYRDNVDQWLDKLQQYLDQLIIDTGGYHDYAIDVRLIGYNGALGVIDRNASMGSEVGVLMIITANSQQDANELARLINPHLLHFPLRDDEPMPTFAFPYSPAHSERGALYEFAINHVLNLDDPLEAFRLEVEDYG